METKPTIETVLERLSAMESRITSRLDALETQVTEGFQKVNAELKLMNRKLEIMTQDIMDRRARARDVEHRMDDVENEVRAKAS